MFTNFMTYLIDERASVKFAMFLHKKNYSKHESLWLSEPSPWQRTYGYPIRFVARADSHTVAPMSSSQSVTGFLNNVMTGSTATPRFRSGEVAPDQDTVCR